MLCCVVLSGIGFCLFDFCSLDHMMMTYVPCATMTLGGGRAMARYAMHRFMYESDWHSCHLCHLCRPCHHDMDGGGGGHRKVCRGTCRDMGTLLGAWFSMAQLGATNL